MVERSAVRARIPVSVQDLRDDAPAVTLATDDGSRGDERGRTFARGETIGRYVVIDRIGEGGMGIVYAAYDPELDRKLALKLLHHDTGDRAEARRLRLVREAQAMARLSHRNVIVVHDVGTYDDQVFVAMEFIDGRSLGAWLAGKRSWSEVLAVLVEAGQGLAAAHDAGLVHRDFKPDNVMIANEPAGTHGHGRVVVTDFGLARAAGNASDDSGALRPDAEHPSHDASTSKLAGKGTLAATVTAVGAIMGTPAYMAPEQHLGRPADARSDQFAFAVVLYEGIYGHRPFPGDDVASLAYHVTAGNLREPPAQSDAPGWLGRVLARALAIDPRARYPDMHALLAELGRDRSWRPRWWGVVAGIGAAAITGVYAGFVLDREPTPCGAGAERIAEVWNAARADAIHQRFAETGLAYVEEQWPVLRAELQSYAKQWSSAYLDACEATHVRGEQSDALLDARMLCLTRRIDELGALLELFERADGAVVERSLSAVQQLPRVRACGQLEALLAPVPPPDDPRVATAVEALRPELARIAALQRAGLYAVGLGAARDLAVRVAELGYDPLHAEVLEHLAAFERASGDAVAAELHLREATTVALRGHADRIAARAAVTLVDLVGREPTRRSEAEGWAEIAEALLARTGGDAELEITLAHRRAVVLRTAGDWAGARAQLERVLAVHERTHGAQDARVAEAAVELAEVVGKAGDLVGARQLLERALEIDEYAFGLEHPKTALVLARLGALALKTGDLDRALEHLERAVAAAELALGRDAPELVGPLCDAGRALAELGREDDAARTLERARVIAELRSDDHQVQAELATALSVAALARGDAASALEHAAHARAELLANGTVEDARTTELDLLTAAALLEFDRGEEALARARAAVTALEQRVPPAPEQTARALLLVGRAELALGAPQLAIDPLQRALGLQDGEGGALGAELRFTLARALWEQPAERARAEQLAQQAGDGLSPDDVRTAALRRAIEAWRRERIGDARGPVQK